MPAKGNTTMNTDTLKLIYTLIGMAMGGAFVLIVMGVILLDMQKKLAQWRDANTSPKPEPPFLINLEK